MNSLFKSRFITGYQLLVFWVSVLSLFLFIYDHGFDQTAEEQRLLSFFYDFTLLGGILSTILRYLERKEYPAIAVRIFDIISVFLFLIILIRNIVVHESIWGIGLFLVFIREFSVRKINYSRDVFNPAQLFVFSFITIIIIGSLLLMLPNATNGSIDYLDALFTSTSAVCVTGLATLDTEHQFTMLGKSIILILIQIGGLGIMTFASYFAYFFRGVSSFENHLALNEMTSANKLGEVFTTLRKIILVTFAIELTGAVLIFLSLLHTDLPGKDGIFFSVFHAISAFCNAGFSTLSAGLYEPVIRHNYFLQTVIAFLIIFGGLGFPIVFNATTYIKSKAVNQYRRITGQRDLVRKPWLLSLSSRIILATTAILLLLGWIFFFIFEYNNTLSEHSLTGKILVSFFGSVTPRTAGFNSVDMVALSFPTIMIYFLLMWIGASPASTGGGIKTSTFAIATMNFISLAKGKTRIEIFRREISDLTVRRAFALIALSLLVIGVAVFLIAIAENDKNLLGIAFECFSAYSTVGLSLGLTPSLSAFSKAVLIVVMFIGRVSMLTLLLAVVKKEKYKNYRYPSEDILIN